MNAKRWMALFLALTLAITMLAGCTKKTETPVADPEQGQTEQEPEQETQNQTQPVTPQQPEQEDKPQPEEPTPDEPQDEQQPVQEPELTPSRSGGGPLKHVSPKLPSGRVMRNTTIRSPKKRCGPI